EHGRAEAARRGCAVARRRREQRRGDDDRDAEPPATIARAHGSCVTRRRPGGQRRGLAAPRRLPPGGRMGSHADMADKWELFGRAVDLVADGKLEDAVATYRAAIDGDPEFADAWQGLALALNDLQRWDEAIEAAKKLCDLTPDDVLAHTTLSRIYQAAG